MLSHAVSQQYESFAQIVLVHPTPSHPDARSVLSSQSEWAHVPCGGTFVVVVSHIELTHAPLQTLKHVPQLFGSLVVSTQSLPQSVS